MTFNDQSAINAHYDTAHAQSTGHSRPERPDARHECEVCGRKFTVKRSLSKHLLAVHGVGGIQTFQCDVCSQLFREKSSLRRHMAAAHELVDVKTFQCEFCFKVFNQKGNLNRHLRNIHS